MNKTSKRITPLRVTIILFVLFGVIQLVPYNRNHVNPPVVQEPKWNSPQTRQTFFRVCKNCHSNETEWPWYSNVSPASWLTQSDVDRGRSMFNVSEWQNPRFHLANPAYKVSSNSMPPWYYRPLHPEGHLSKEERAKFAGELAKTFNDSTAQNQ